MEETNSKNDLPPFSAKDVFLKERTADLSKGASHIGTETLWGLVSNLDRVLQYSDRKHTSRHEAKEQSEVLVDNSVYKGHTRRGQQKTGQQNSLTMDM